MPVVRSPPALPAHPRPPVSFALCASRVKGKNTDEVLTIKNSDIAKHLSLPPVKLHCSMLAEDAIKAAVKNLQEKQAKQKATTEGSGQQQQAVAAAATA